MENKIIKNILSKEQIKNVYQIIDSTPDELTRIQNRLGHKAYMVGLGDDVKNTLQSVVQQHYGKDWTVRDYQFARYSKKYGYETKLYPHFDDAFETHRLTLDVQVHSTVSWPIVVEGKEFLLNDNEGVVFFGTDQVHWRTNMQLSDDDIVDMIFCHCENLSDPRNPVTKEHRDNMRKIEEVWLNKVNVKTEPILVDRKDSGE
jgi:hypothetical protein